MSFRYICTGSSTFSPSLKAGVGAVGPAMILTFFAGVVAGVLGLDFEGFLHVTRESGPVENATALFYLIAALGMGIGGGYYALTLPATAAVLVVLWLFPFIEHWIDGLKTSRQYEAVSAAGEDATAEIEAIFAKQGLKVFPKSRHKRGEKWTCTWYVVGSPDGHRAAVSKLLASDRVQELSY